MVSGALILAGAFSQANPTRFKGIPYGIESIEWTKENVWAFAVFCPIAVALLQFIRRVFGNPWAREAIQNTLNQLRNDIYKQYADDPIDNHRVTLYKYRRWRPVWYRPRSGLNWLIPVARSGHLTQKGIRKFRVPDKAHECEGVVGHAFRQSGWLVSPQGNEVLTKLDTSSTDEEIERHAALTFISPDWVRGRIDKSLPMSLSFAALKIRLNGQEWGVVVLDSRSSDKLTQRKLDRYTVYANILTPLLERI